MTRELIALAAGLRGRYEEQMEHYAFQNALAEIFKVISRANKYIDTAPAWPTCSITSWRPPASAASSCPLHPRLL